MKFADGTVWDQAKLLAQEVRVVGDANNNTLIGHNGGPNLMLGNDGNDTLYGGDGNDRQEGGNGNDYLAGQAGHDLLLGQAGDDQLYGDAGDDTLDGGVGNDYLQGGTGTLTTGAGDDILCFNQGDGQDIVTTGGTGNDTLSLGGAFAYADLALRKNRNDLILQMGTADQITFKDWYAATPSKPVINLQVITEAMAAFDRTGADTRLDQKVERFDFAGLASAFDAARTANPGLTRWALADALTQFQLAGSDTAALGGDLAYQYGRNGTLTGVGLAAAQGVLGDAGFGTQAQALNPTASLQSGPVRLG